MKKRLFALLLVFVMILCCACGSKNTSSGSKGSEQSETTATPKPTEAPATPTPEPTPTEVPEVTEAPDITDEPAPTDFADFTTEAGAQALYGELISHDWYVNDYLETPVTEYVEDTAADLISSYVDLSTTTVRTNLSFNTDGTYNVFFTDVSVIEAKFEVKDAVSQAVRNYLANLAASKGTSLYREANELGFANASDMIDSYNAIYEDALNSLLQSGSGTYEVLGDYEINMDNCDLWELTPLGDGTYYVLVDDGGEGDYFLYPAEAYPASEIVKGEWFTYLDIMDKDAFGSLLLDTAETASIDTSYYPIVAIYDFKDDGTYTFTYDSDSIDEARDVLYDRIRESIIEYQGGLTDSTDTLTAECFEFYNEILDNMKSLYRTGNTYAYVGTSAINLDDMDLMEMNIIYEDFFFAAVDEGYEGCYYFFRSGAFNW